MKASREIKLFVAVSEAYVRVAYRDGGTDAEPLYSFGFGQGGAHPSDETTMEKAMARLSEELDMRALQLSPRFTAPVNQFLFDGVLSAYYQGGNRNAGPLIALVNAGYPMDAVEHFTVRTLCLNKAGEFKPGLLIRREREQRIARSGDYGDLSKIKVYNSHPVKGQPEDELYAVKPEDFTV